LRLEAIEERLAQLAPLAARLESVDARWQHSDLRSSPGAEKKEFSLSILQDV
jgi:hypothetical protein